MPPQTIPFSGSAQTAATPPATVPFASAQAPSAPSAVPRSLPLSTPVDSPTSQSIRSTPLFQSMFGPNGRQSKIASAEGSAFQSSLADASPQTFNPIKIGQSVEDAYTSAIQDAGDKVAKVWEDMGLFGNKASNSALKTGVDVAGGGIGVVNGLLSPIGAAFKGAESVPVVGTAAKYINALFSAIGAGGSTAATNAVDDLPISDEAKQTIRPVAADAGALAAQIIAGKGTDEAVSSLHGGIQTILNTIKGNPKIAEPVSDAIGSEIKGKSTELAPENKTIPQKGPTKSNNAPENTKNTANSPIPAPKSAPKVGVVDVRTAKSAADLSQTAAERGFEALPDEERAKYSPTTKADQIQRVSDIMSKDIEDAKSVIRGEKPVPNGVKGQVLWNAMERHAMETGDGELLNDLAKSPLASQRSIHAQELGASGFNQNEHSPASLIREVSRAREDDYLKKSGQAAPKARVRLIDTERLNMRDEIRSNVSKRPSWEEFANRIKCNY